MRYDLYIYFFRRQRVKCAKSRRLFWRFYGPCNTIGLLLYNQQFAHTMYVYIQSYLLHVSAICCHTKGETQALKDNRSVTHI